MAKSSKVELSIVLRAVNLATKTIRKVTAELGAVTSQLKTITATSGGAGSRLKRGMVDGAEGARKAAAKVKSVGTESRKATKEVSGLSRALKTAGAVGRRMTTLVTLPIIAMGAGILRASGNFEDGLAKIKTLGHTDAEVKNIGKSILDLSKDVPVAIGELTDSFQKLESASFSTAQSTMMLKDASHLGIAAMGTTQQAVDIATSAISAFQLKGDAATRVFDTLFKVVAKGKTELPVMTQGFGKAAAAAHGSQVSIEDFSASVAAMTLGGLKAPEAYTQITAVLGALGKKTKETSKLFRSLGVKDFQGLKKKAGGLGGALKLINDKLGGNADRIREVVRSSEAMSAVMIIGGAQNKAYAKTYDAMVNGEEALTKAAKARMGTQKAAIQSLKNSFARLAISLGKILVPVFKKVAAGVEEVVGWFDKLDDEQKEWLVTVLAIGAVVGPAIFVIVKLAAALGFVTTAFRVMTLAMVTNPLGAAIAAIAIAVTLIYTYWGPISGFFSDLWNGIVSSFEAALAKILQVVDKIVKAASRVKSLVVGAIDMDAARDQLRAKIADRKATTSAAAGIGSATPSYVTASASSARPDSPTADVKNNVIVNVNNAPPGTRTTIESTGDADVSTNVGSQVDPG